MNNTGLAAGVRAAWVTLLSVVGLQENLVRHKHWLDKDGEPRFVAHSKCSSPLRLHPYLRPRVRTILQERQISLGLRLGLLGHARAEFRAVTPHGVQNDGELAGHGNDGALASLALHQPIPP